jgi:hypothetical protein
MPAASAAQALTACVSRGKPGGSVMNVLRFVGLFLLFGLTRICLGASQEEMRQLIEAAKYGDAVVQADALLANKQIPVADHYGILMLKGEAALRASQRPLAVSAFRAATRLATDRPQAIAAAANAILAQRIQNGTIRIGDATLDVIKPEDRLLAMQKLADQIHANQALQVETALTAGTLDPITEVLPDIYRMYVLEMQATDGKSTVAEPLVRKLGTQAYDLIANELRRVQRDISVAERSSYSFGDWSGWSTSGLTTPQRRELRDKYDYIARIRDAILQIRRLGATLRVNTDPWDRLTADCVDLQDQISNVLNRTY